MYAGRQPLYVRINKKMLPIKIIDTIYFIFLLTLFRQFQHTQKTNNLGQDLVDKVSVFYLKETNHNILKFSVCSWRLINSGIASQTLTKI